MRVSWGLAVAGAALAAAGGTFAATHAAQAVELVPHRAFYKMQLASTKLAGGVSAATGAMTYEFSDSCDGWTVENKTVLTFVYAEGGQVNTTWDFLTWESKDGLSYRFKVRSTRDGMVTEEVDGVARLDGKGLGGVARFTLPEPMTVSLPKGTLFPTDHTRRLIERAQAGDAVYNRVVFDGSGEDGPFEVNALIGKANGQTSRINAGPVLLAVPSYPVNMAFYPVNSQDAAPDYEVNLHYHVNGIAADVTQVFDTFSLKGTLDKVENKPKPDC